jgi:hypothetical protein
MPLANTLERCLERRALRSTLQRVLFVCSMSMLGCSDDAAEMFNCYLAPDVPPIVIREDSASAATKKCEQEQGQTCTCSPVQTYKGIVSPN